MLKKWIAASLAMTLTLSLLTGCEDYKENTDSSDTTKIVRVSKVDGTTITADVGELNTNHPEMPSGDRTPPGAPDNKQQEYGTGSENTTDGNQSKNGEPPAGKPGGSRFTENGESITFSITDSTKVTQEFQQGSEDASAEDIVENSILEVTLDSKN